MARVAGVPVRHPQIVAAGRHYDCKVETCEPFDPESKGGAEHTVKIAKADLVPTTANLLPAYSTFTDSPTPVSSGASGSTPALTAKPGPPRVLGWPPNADTTAGLTEIARHVLSTPGSPRIDEAHYPHHPGGHLPRPPKIRARTPEEVAFLALDEGARRWLVEAASTGVTRIRVKMAKAVELAAVLDPGRVDDALGLAAIAGRFAEDDLASILDHLTASGPPSDVVVADEAHSAQPGTSGWEVFGK